MSYQPHQQRVIEERDELAKKGKALNDFILFSNVFTALDEAEKGRLQSNGM